uniref:Kielin cysteine rich BMP regulator n=1 Tax=Callorhinchus milii TaxID=7868 RepID=A0A4W3J5X1_CALMI
MPRLRSQTELSPRSSGVRPTPISTGPGPRPQLEEQLQSLANSIQSLTLTLNTLTAQVGQQWLTPHLTPRLTPRPPTPRLTPHLTPRLTPAPRHLASHLAARHLASHLAPDTSPHTSPPDTSPHTSPYTSPPRHLALHLGPRHLVLHLNVELRERVRRLEECECQVSLCLWKGREYRNGSQWNADQCSICVCARGQVTCSTRTDSPLCRDSLGWGWWVSPDFNHCGHLKDWVLSLILSLSFSLSHSLSLTFCPSALGRPPDVKGALEMQDVVCQLSNSLSISLGCLHLSLILSLTFSLSLSLSRSLTHALTISYIFSHALSHTLSVSLSRNHSMCLSLSLTLSQSLALTFAILHSHFLTHSHTLSLAGCIDEMGMSHTEGTSWHVGCQLCVCQGGAVSCTHLPCPSTPTPPCSASSPSQCCPTCVGGGEVRCGGCGEGRVSGMGVMWGAPDILSLPSGGCCPECSRCRYHQQDFSDGQEFTDPESPCHTCRCQAGTVHCLLRPCPPVTCTRPEQRPGQCCPKCPDCRYEEGVYVDGQRFPSPRSPCQECVCVNGSVSCQDRACRGALCSNPLAGSCCLNNCNGCNFAGKEYPNGADFPHPTNLCKECHCLVSIVSCLPTHHRAPRLLPASPTHPPPLLPPSTDTHPPLHPSTPPPAQCQYSGLHYKHMERFYDPTEPCRSCMCANGTVTCQRTPCAPCLCSHPILQDCCRTCDGCLFEGKEYANGEQFADPGDGCSVCACREGSVTCERRPCAVVECPFPMQGPCCRLCDGCGYLGEEYLNGQEFPAMEDRCSRCECSGGFVTCTKRPCYSPGCPHPSHSHGECCPVCEGCLYSGVTIGNGQTVPDPADPVCSQCTCRTGTVRCGLKLCPEPQCPHPAFTPCGCAVCDGCSYNNRDCSNGETFTDPSNTCQICTCLAGAVSCVPVGCPALACGKPVELPGECCPRCPSACDYLGRVYTSGSTFTAPSDSCSKCSCLVSLCVPEEVLWLCVTDCVFEGQVYGPGESFTPNTDPCDICTCEVSPLSLNPPQLRCYQRQCPSLVDCPKHLIQFPAPDQCCPRCAQPLSNCTDSLHGSELLATDNPCYTCHCNDLTWTCVHQDCPLLSCPRHEQVTSEGACCPHCDECVIELERRRVSDGETWTDNTDACVTCTCNLGYIECQVEECEPLLCQDGLLAVTTPAHCCPECQDPMISCMYQGRVYSSNQHWEVDQCTRCTCVSGEVHCQTDRCTLLTCASDETPALVPGMCCPHCMPRPATCVAFGDPHYRTFDGKMIHFQGTCSYVLAQDCQAGDFSVRVTNDDRGRVGVAWTKEVTVLVADVHCVVQVDGHTVSLPFLREPYIYIERKTNTILLNTNIGVKVLWDGRSHLEVSVAGTYRGQTCGLCGNFNNFPQDELQLRSGLTTISQAAFGNSWKVTDGNETGAGCVDGQDIDPCKEAGYRARKEANAKCKILKSAAFQPCHTLVPPEMFFGSCVYDLCACGATGLPGGDTGDGCLCDVLEAYTSECREAGIILHWRSPGLCGRIIPSPQPLVTAKPLQPRYQPRDGHWTSCPPDIGSPKLTQYSKQREQLCLTRETPLSSIFQ